MFFMLLHVAFEWKQSPRPPQATYTCDSYTCDFGARTGTSTGTNINTRPPGLSSRKRASAPSPDELASMNSHGSSSFEELAWAPSSNELASMASLCILLLKGPSRHGTGTGAGSGSGRCAALALSLASALAMGRRAPSLRAGAGSGSGRRAALALALAMGQRAPLLRAALRAQQKAIILAMMVALAMANAMVA